MIASRLGGVIGSSDVAEGRKAYAVNFLESLGIPFPEQEIAEYIPNYREIATKQIKNLVDNLSDSPSHFSIFLDAGQGNDSEAASDGDRNNPIIILVNFGLPRRNLPARPMRPQPLPFLPRTRALPHPMKSSSANWAMPLFRERYGIWNPWRAMRVIKFPNKVRVSGLAFVGRWFLLVKFRLCVNSR